jgi:hypothetical protein
MYKDVSKKELELLLEQTKRELKLYTQYYEKLKVNEENYNKQINLLLDDLKALQKELEKRK